MDIFKLVGSIFVDTEEANKSISKTDSKASGLVNTLANGAKKAGKFGLAVVGGATAAAGAMLGLANNTASTADEIDKASIRMGVGAEDFQRLAYAAGQCGVETTALEKAAKKLSGTGINMKDALKQITSLKTAEERAAAAADLFGESVAYQLTPLIETGEGYDELINRADELGIVMSEDAVKAGVTLGDTMSDVKQSLGALANQVGSAVMPMVQKFLELILDNLPTLQSLVAMLIPVIIQLADALLPPLMELIQALLPSLVGIITQLMPFVTQLIEQVMPIIVQLIQTLLPPLMQIIEALMPVLVTLLDACMPLLTVLIQLLQPILDLLLKIIVPVVQLVAELLQPIIRLLGELLTNALKPLEPVIRVIGELFGAYLGEVFKGLGVYLDVVITWFSGLIDFFTKIFAGDFKGAWESITNTFKTIFGKIKDYAKDPINAVLGFINKLISGVTEGINGLVRAMNNLSFDIPDWVPGMGGKSFGFNLSTLSAPQIPLLAKGGEIIGDGAAIVGEKGPELLNLPQGARVTPLDKAGIDYEKVLDCITDVVQEIIQAIKELGQNMSNSENSESNIIIPVYIGDQIIDELIIDSKRRVSVRSGGMANV